VVNNTIPGSITQYSIDRSSGALTLLPTATIAAGNGTSNSPFFGTTDVNGHLFVANLGNTSTDPQAISTYNITSNGQLQSAGPDVAISAGTTPATALSNVLTDTSGHFPYALDDNATGAAGKVFAYSYTVGSSGLSLTNGTVQPTGFASTGMAIDPTGTLLAIDKTLDGTGTNGPRMHLSIPGEFRRSRDTDNRANPGRTRVHHVLQRAFRAVIQELYFQGRGWLRPSPLFFERVGEAAT